MWCHSDDEATGTNVPVGPPQPGHADTVPIFPHRFIAKIDATAFYNESGPGQSGKVTWEGSSITMYYDYANNRLRQDVVANGTYPTKSGVQWFNGSNAKWYVFDAASGYCVILPPPIVTVQRPDFMLSPANGLYIGEETVHGHRAHHWFAGYKRQNPFGMKSNASFDLWLDAESSSIVKLEGKCDPPDVASGDSNPPPPMLSVLSPALLLLFLSVHLFSVSAGAGGQPHRRGRDLQFV